MAWSDSVCSSPGCARLADDVPEGKDPREKSQSSAGDGQPDIFTVTKAVGAYDKAHISRLKPRSQLEARRHSRSPAGRWPDRALAEVTKGDIREVLTEMVEAGNPVAANRALAGSKRSSAGTCRMIG